MLNIRALGTLSLDLNGVSLLGRLPRKGSALLVYLAAIGEIQPRHLLTELLWSDQSPEKSSANLRAVIVPLRKELEPHLEITRQTIGLAATHTFDGATFLQALAKGDLEEGLALYRGDFLFGFSLEDADEYERWIVEQRQYFRQKFIDSAMLLVQRYGESEQALHWAKQVARVDPLNEDAHFQVIRLLALSGKRAAALEHFTQFRAMLHDEIGVEPAPETLALVQSIRDSAAQVSQPVPQSTPTRAESPQNTALQSVNVELPKPQTTLQGRTRELAQITAWLGAPDCRLLTLTGAGGMGKTRLAIEAAAQLAPKFEHGAYFVPLAPVTQSDVVATSIASTLHVSAGKQESYQRLLNHVRDKSLLLVLDNFEHVIGAKMLVGDLLQHAPRLKILVTSRERLNIGGEWLLPVEGLTVPSEHSPIDSTPASTSLAQYDAIMLFEHTARRVRAGFRAEQHAAQVIRICQLLQGMPLGIEIAASWIRSMTPGRILMHIERGFDFLASTTRNVPERHRSMRAVFESSWMLLEPPQREVLQRLSVFRGGFTLEAAQAVSGANGRLLSGLVDKSLLRYTDSRYEMHELLRQFAGEKLDAHPEVASATRTAHSAYYAAFLKDREDRLEGAVHREIVLETLQDMDNIRAAQHTLIEQCNAPLIADFLRPLFHLLDAQSLYAEGEQVFRRMATCLRGLDPFITAQPTARAMVLQGIFLHLLTRYGEAQAVFEATLPAMRKLHADGNAAVVWELRLQLSYMGALHYARGDYPNAKIYYEAAIELFREAGIMAQAGEALMRLSEIAVVMGEYAHAKAIIGDALPLFWEMGSRRSRILFLNTLGDIECKLGEYMEAKLHFEESLQLSRALNYRVNTGVALVSLGRVAYGLGNYAESSQFCRESLVICEDTGNAWGKSFALAHLGRAHAALGEFHEAQAHYEHSLQLSQEIGNRWVMCFTLRQCGRLAAQHGAWQSAAHYLYESLLLARDMNVPPLILDALAGAAGCLAQSSTPHGLERAQAIASYVSNHPITEYEARRDANALLEPDTQSSDEPLDSVAAIGLSWLEEILTVDSTSRE